MGEEEKPTVFVLPVSGEELLICSVQHADSQSKQAADDGDRWSRFPAKFKPVVEEAVSYHGDWLGGVQCFVKSVANGL